MQKKYLGCIFKGFTIIFVFTFLIFLISRIDFLGIFKVDAITNDIEKKLGDFIWDDLKRNNEELYIERSYQIIDSFVNVVIQKNKLENKNIQFHIVNNSEINAFAIPGARIIINSGLIQQCNNFDELMAVICHEIAHVEKGHVLKKVKSEISVLVLSSLSSGNASPEQLKKVINLLYNTNYSRKLEKEADLLAVYYLHKSKINPKALIDFFSKLEDYKTDKIITIHTHPDNKTRINYIMDEIKKLKPEKYVEYFEKKDWNNFVKSFD